MKSEHIFLPKYSFNRFFTPKEKSTKNSYDNLSLYPLNDCICKNNEHIINALFSPMRTNFKEVPGNIHFFIILTKGTTFLFWEKGIGIRLWVNFAIDFRLSALEGNDLGWPNLVQIFIIWIISWELMNKTDFKTISLCIPL